MKLHEMTTDKAFDTLIEVIVCVEEITKDPEYRKYLEAKRKKSTEVDGNAFAKMLYGGKHREAVIKILALVDEKTPEEIRDMPYKEVHKLLSDVLHDPELAGFFVP